MANEAKTRFIRQVQQSATLLARVIGEFNALAVAYQARGYGAGNPITDADIVDTGLTAANMAEIVALATNLSKFANNLQVTPADHNAILARLRVDI